MSKRTAHNKLSEEEVLQEFKEKHGNAFDYSRVKYVDGNTPVEIYCKKHDFTFYPTPKSHKNGSKCKHCGREEQIKKARKEVEKFKEQIIEIYGDKYNLDLIDYKNTKTPVIIGCPIHGEKTRKPCDILQGIACDECDKKKTKSTDKELFILEAKKVYGDKDDYTNTNVVSSRENIKIRCTKHDLVFEKNIQTYLVGWGCPECSAENYSRLRRKTNEQFIKESIEKHGERFDYSGTEYTTAKNNLFVRCKKHDFLFETLPDSHTSLISGGCKKCYSEYISEKYKGREGTCGYTKTRYIKQANGRESKVYIIRCWNENEEFYKIGKTFLEIETRFKTNKLMPYLFEEVDYFKGEAGFIYDLEKALHRKYKEYKYKPSIFFPGYTECFKNLPLNENIWETK